MLNPVTSSIPRSLYTSTWQKTNQKIHFRTAFKSENHVINCDALLSKSSAKSLPNLLGLKSLKIIQGPVFFEHDRFRLECPEVTKIPENTPIPQGLAVINVEPGVWSFVPVDDMELDKFKKLLGSMPFTDVKRAKTPVFFGEGKAEKLSRKEMLSVDVHLVDAIEHQILRAFRLCGNSTDEAKRSLDSDICRLRTYLNFYREFDPQYQKFVDSGTLVRIPRPSCTFVRPNLQFVHGVVQDELAYSARMIKQRTKEVGSTKPIKSAQSVEQISQHIGVLQTWLHEHSVKLKELGTKSMIAGVAK